MNLAIKGHATHGKEVIQLLEMLGGESVNGVKGCGTESSYYINKKGIIDFSLFNTKTSKEGWIILTLEQFLEKFPYKVGDKVVLPEYEIEVPITQMKWDGNDIMYCVTTCYGNRWFTSEYLKDFNSYETKKDLDWHPADYLEFVDNAEWADEVELNLGDSYEIVMKDGKILAVKKPQYSEYIKVGELKEMLSQLDNDDLITVTKGNSSPNYRISHVEDSTSCGFYELRIE